ncbi:hypothetical protein DPMN_044513 [Dreissena polymorpha]|uniref:Uncharacterized protein n=1 Tax=Dreissena polymorpha TaxID=45954 RepID=A0A9D4D4K2_DREPO|nr:hypothetical protein DPMN_044513 [Dreissena polymorpha]
MKHVHQAILFDTHQTSITLEDHRTSRAGYYAYFYKTRDIYDILLGYCKLILQGKANADEDAAGYQPVFGTGDEDARHSSINKWLYAAWKK